MDHNFTYLDYYIDYYIAVAGILCWYDYFPVIFTSWLLSHKWLFNLLLASLFRECYHSIFCTACTRAVFPEVMNNVTCMLSLSSVEQIPQVLSFDLDCIKYNSPKGVDLSMAL